MAVGPLKPKTSYDKLAPLKEGAEALDKAAKEAAPAAKQAKSVDAFNLEKAQGAALSATAGLLEAEAALLQKGVQGWSAEGVREGARYVAKGAARGLSQLSHGLAKSLGPLKSTTVSELLHDPSGTKFSDRMLGRAARQLKASAEAMNLCWAQYAEAISKLPSAGASASFAAGHVSQVAGNLAKAAALTTSASATKMAEFGVKLGGAAMAAADLKDEGTQRLTTLTARFAGLTASVLASVDPGGLKELVKGHLQAVKGELAQLVEQHPGLSGPLAALL